VHSLGTPLTETRVSAWHQREASLRVVPPYKPRGGLLVQEMPLQLLLQLVAPLTSIAPRVPRRLDFAVITAISSFDVCLFALATLLLPL